jgi:hypothetical protein
MGKVIYQTTQIDNSGIEGSLSVGLTAIELKVGDTTKDGRTSATLYNNSLNIVYWGYTSLVTTLTGTPIYPKQFISWNNQQPTSMQIFLIANSSGNDVRITEVS